MNAKPRIDAWETPLAEERRWEVYAKMKEWPWHKAMAWAEREFGIPAPSRQGAYNFADRMRKLEGARRVELALTARAEAGELATLAAPDDQKMIDAYKALAADMAMRLGDAETAGLYTKMALAIGEQRLKRQALELNRKKFEAQEKRLAAVREAVGKAREDGGLTPETLKKIEQAAGLL